MNVSMSPRSEPFIGFQTSLLEMASPKIPHSDNGNTVELEELLLQVSADSSSEL